MSNELDDWAGDDRRVDPLTRARMHEIEVSLNARYKRVVRWIMAMVVTGLIACSVIFIVLRDQSSDIGAQADSNRNAIKISCTLLVNAIVESGANNSNGGDATRLFVTAIKRIMTPAERKQLDSALAGQTGHSVTLPPCERISEHPETVKAIPLASPTPTVSP